MKKVFYLLVFLVGTLGNLSAQMVLFKGTFEEAEEKAKEEKKDLFVDFYADWCGPCKALHPVLEELSKEYSGKVDIYQIDVDQEKELAAAFGIRSIPTLLLIPMKEEPRITQGALPKDQLKKAIDEFLLKQNNEAK